jgi:hypothetical protein
MDFLRDLLGTRGNLTDIPGVVLWFERRFIILQRSIDFEFRDGNSLPNPDLHERNFLSYFNHFRSGPPDLHSALY